MKIQEIISEQIESLTKRIEPIHGHVLNMISEKEALQAALDILNEKMPKEYRIIEQYSHIEPLTQYGRSPCMDASEDFNVQEITLGDLMIAQYGRSPAMDALSGYTSDPISLKTEDGSGAILAPVVTPEITYQDIDIPGDKTKKCYEIRLKIVYILKHSLGDQDINSIHAKLLHKFGETLYPSTVADNLYYLIKNDVVVCDKGMYSLTEGY